MKKTRLNEIIYKRVVEVLKPRLEMSGFVFKKGIWAFVKKDMGLQHEISFRNDYSIYLDTSLQSEHELYLGFELTFTTSMPDFDDWYKQNISKTDLTTIYPFHKLLTFCIPLTEDEDYKIPDDFPTGTSTFIGDEYAFLKQAENNYYLMSEFDKEVLLPDFYSHRQQVFETMELMLLPLNYIEVAKEYEEAKKGFFIKKCFALMIYKNYKDIAGSMLEKQLKFIKESLAEDISEARKEELNDALVYLTELGRKYLNESL